MGEVKSLRPSWRKPCSYLHSQCRVIHGGGITAVIPEIGADDRDRLKLNRAGIADRTGRDLAPASGLRASLPRSSHALALPASRVTAPFRTVPKTDPLMHRPCFFPGSANAAPGSSRPAGQRA